MLLAACVSGRQTSSPLTLSDDPAPAVSTDYGVYSFASEWLAKGDAARSLVVDTIWVLDSTEAALGQLGDAAPPPGFDGVMSSLQTRIGTRQHLTTGFAVRWPVVLVSLSSAATHPDHRFYGFSRPGYNSDLTRAAVFAEVVELSAPAGSCPTRALLFLARKPGRQWVLLTSTVLACQ